LELVFVPRGEVARGVEVFGRAVDFVFQFGLGSTRALACGFTRLAGIIFRRRCDGRGVRRGTRGACAPRSDCPKRVLEPFLDERNGEVRDVYADPLAVELLRGVNGRAATAER
jgi:hypothetical protein